MVIHSCRWTPLVLTTAMLFLVPTTPSLFASAHKDGGYLYDDDIGYYNQNWMASVANHKKISELSIPGTHDTMTYDNGDNVLVVNCQTLDLTTQLNAGIRFLDIRARHHNNVFPIHHGPYYVNKNFDDVMGGVISFLQKHDSETVIMRLKKEHTEEGNTRTFSETLDWYMTKNNHRYGNFVWRGTGTNPTLGEVRGKIVMVNNFGSSSYAPIGWGNLNIQDDYKLTTNWDLYGKWEKVKNQMNRAISGPRNTIFVNFLSGSVGSFPYFVASGHSSQGTSAPRLATGRTTPGWNGSWPDFPRVSCFIGICTIAFEGTNTLTKNYLKQRSNARVGIIVADFPGWELIDTVIRQNQS